jgi:hypothetical protein
MRRLLRFAFAVTCLLGAGGVARAQVEPTAKQPSSDDPSLRPHRLTIEFRTLRLLRDKGIISDAEYESAMREVGDTAGEKGGDSLTLMLAKFSTTMYGFVESDYIWDSTQSFNDLAGNGAVAKGTTYAGQNWRFTMGIRNSRLGFRIRAPEFHRVRASAQLEMDFLGNQQPIGYTPGQAFVISENAFFTNPAFRVRHMNLKLETPIVDILFGQYWHLFGWQSLYHPNTVEIQGVPGQIYSRTPQLRLSKTIKTNPVTLELAVAMMRAPQRDSWTPEGQAGIRLAFNKWTAVATAGPAGTTIQPLSVALTGDLRQFNLPPFSGKTTDATLGKTGWGVAVDAFAPLVPGRKGHKRNSLAANGEYAYGFGIADLYTGLSAGALGIANPTIPPAMAGGTATPFSPNVDPALALFDAAHTVHMIQIQSFLVGVQYYLPVADGMMWVSANYSHLSSNNAQYYRASATTTPRIAEDWADANFFVDATPAVRLGLEYAWFHDKFTDGTFANNHRIQFSAFYIF